MPSTPSIARAEPPGAPAIEVRRPNVVVSVLAFAGVTVALMQTVVIPLVPRLPALLGSTAADTAWAITATLLAAAVATPTVGRLGDMYGKRRMLLVSLGLLVAGSVLAALSTSLAPLVVARVLQGLASGVIPLGISIMRDELPTWSPTASTGTCCSGVPPGSAWWPRHWWWRWCRSRRSAPAGASTSSARSVSRSSWCASCWPCPRAPRGAGRAASRSA